MCTAISYSSDYHYFGRNLDLEYHYKEEITITPRNFPLPFRMTEALTSHYAIIGMAYVAEGYPLYYDATNEMGLSMAGLNFPGNCIYREPVSDKDNITPFEFIPWILGLCSSVTEAKTLLTKINLTKIPFSDTLPLSPLHWLISDSKTSLVVEPTKEGLKIYDNPAHVLTNNPTFDKQLFHLNNYVGLSNRQPTIPDWQSSFLSLYSRGMGALGLPGDYSSGSRFAKAFFVKNCCESLDKKMAESATPASAKHNSLSQFFHILSSVQVPKGCVEVENGSCQYTIYSSCCNTDLGIYYYTTYDSFGLHAVHLHHTNLDGNCLFCYPLITKTPPHCQN